MTDLVLAPRRRSRWGLFAAPVLLVIAAIARGLLLQLQAMLVTATFGRAVRRAACGFMEHALALPISF